MDGLAANPEADLARVRDALRNRGGADLMLLGLGRNGHVALNEPGSSLATEAGVRQLHDTTYRGILPFFDRQGCPTHGMTLGMTDIVQSRRISLMVLGSGKAVILRAVLTEPATSQHPASLLRDLPGFEVRADEEACTLLPPGLAERAAQA